VPQRPSRPQAAAGKEVDIMRNAHRSLLLLLTVALAGVPLSALASDLPERVDIDIDTDRNDGGGVWYGSPFWLAIGAIGLIVLVLFVVLAVRGGGGGATVVTR
jgi:hypothetical protein